MFCLFSGFAVADATTTTSSSSSSEFPQRKRPPSVGLDPSRPKEAKVEVNSGAAATDDGVQTQQHANMKELFEMMMHSVTSLAATLASSHSSSQTPLLQQDPQSHHRSLPPSWTAARLNQLKTEEPEGDVDELLVQTDDEEEVEEERCPASPRPLRPKRKSVDGLLEEFLRKTEARDAQRERDMEQRDDVTLFLLSLAPAMRRLTAEKQSWVRTKMQQFLHEAEFGATKFQ